MTSVRRLQIMVVGCRTPRTARLAAIKKVHVLISSMSCTQGERPAILQLRKVYMVRIVKCATVATSGSHCAAWYYYSMLER